MEAKQKKSVQALNALKKKYPQAKNITYGSNNIVFGYWFINGDNAKHRNFYQI